MPADPTNDLNSVITSAVQARIEAEVTAALSGSELMGQYVAAALHQQITVKASGYGRDRQTTFLKEVIDKAIQAAVRSAVEKLIAEETEEIEKAVSAELKNRRGEIAKDLVGSLQKAAESTYGVTVELKMPGRG